MSEQTSSAAPKVLVIADGIVYETDATVMDKRYSNPWLGYDDEGPSISLRPLQNSRRQGKMAVHKALSEALKQS